MKVTYCKENFPILKTAYKQIFDSLFLPKNFFPARQFLPKKNFFLIFVILPEERTNNS
jgi:hypothetical protein